MLVLNRSRPLTPTSASPSPALSPSPWHRAAAETERGRTAPGAPAGVCPPVQRGGVRPLLFVSPPRPSSAGAGGFVPPGRHLGVVAFGCRLLHQPIQQLNLQIARSVPPKLSFQLETPLARGAPGRGPWCLRGLRQPSPPRPGQLWGGMGWLPWPWHGRASELRDQSRNHQRQRERETAPEQTTRVC